MTIATIALCASALLAAPESGTNAPPAAATQAAKEASLSKAAQPQAAEAADKARQTPATPPEFEEKEVDGVKLLPIEANVVSYTNQERARYGLPPLEVDKELMATAREHCRLDDAESVDGPHPASGGGKHRHGPAEQRRRGAGLDELVRPPGEHPQPGNRRIGVAAYRTESGTIFWCQQFRN